MTRVKIELHTPVTENKYSVVNKNNSTKRGKKNKNMGIYLAGHVIK